MMTAWDDWIAAYEMVYVALPSRGDVPCPACGHSELRLVFTGDLDRAVGYASFWCEACLHGVVISRVPIPDGAVARSRDVPPEERLPKIPNFTLIDAE